jgi:TonB family protein
MAPITKEPETLNPAQRGTGTMPSQPAAAEIPVTVNGARAVEDSDRREPFSENTQTVLVFANGGVIRLSSPVSAGQLLFLTNQKTKKEVVCQVVKSKNYSSVSGYVELEFTEAASGFWGIRFPASEDPASVAANPPLTIPAPAIPAYIKPVEEGIAKTNPSKSAAQFPVNKISAVVAKTTRKQLVPQSLVIAADRPRKPNLALIASAEQPSGEPKTPTLSEFLTHGESGLELKPEPVKQLIHAQEQAAKTIAQAPTSAEAAKSVRDSEKKESLTNLLVPAPPREDPAPGTYTFDFAADEVKIPAWLEPLARNSAAVPALPEAKIPATNSDAKASQGKEFLAAPTESLLAIYDSDEPERLESPSREAVEEDSDRQAIFTLAGDGPTPNFGSSLALDAKPGDAESEPRGSGSALKFGLLAAGFLLSAAGGWYWYSKQPQSVAVNRRTAAAPAISGAAGGNTPALPASNESSPQPAKSDLSSAAEGVAANRSAASLQTIRTDNKEFATVPSGVSRAAANSNQVVAASAPAGRSPDQPEAMTLPATEPQKKPALGHVRLAAPVVRRRDLASDNNNIADAAPALGVTAGDPGSVSVLASKNIQPAAPIAVGGDVKPARLLTSLAPEYPQMARNRHISGDVKIDALVDASGRVSGMRVISGSALLHEAALDAVRQWKYQPATLNGQAVSTHLTVTVQFKLQ